MKYCPKCNAQCSDSNQFCTNCGNILPKEKFCTRCGCKLNPRDHFCTRCGAFIENIPTSQESEAPEVQNPVTEYTPVPQQTQNEAVDETVNKGVVSTPHAYTDEENTTQDSVQPQVNLQDYDFEPPRKSKTPLVVFIVLSFIVICGGVLFWLFRDDILGSKKNIEEMAYDAEVAVEQNNELTSETENAEIEYTPRITSNATVYLSGKIDRKYPVHMILDLKQREGVYYYDKYGPSNIINVYISSLHELDNGNWNISITKHTDRYDNEEKWYGILTGETFSGTGEYLSKEMPFDLTVDEILTNMTDPLIEKSLSSRTSSDEDWVRCEFTGYVSGGEKEFPVRITALRNGSWEFKNANYYNIDYNVSIPVDIEFDNPDFYVVQQSGQKIDLYIKARKDGNEFRGTMTTNGASLPIVLTIND